MLNWNKKDLFLSGKNISTWKFNLLTPIKSIELRTYLHKEAGHEGLPYVDIVVAAGELGTRALQIKTVHNSGQLSANAIGALQRSIIHKVLVTPRRILVIYPKTKRIISQKSSNVKQSKLMSNLDRDIRQNIRCRCLQSMAFLKCLDTKQSIVKWATVLSIFRQ